MALNTGSGFSNLTRMESQIQAVIATYVADPTPKNQPYVSKKKEARRQREEQERQLALLRSTPLDQLDFVPLNSEPTQAATAQSELAELEQQMRIALGIDVVKPTEVVKAKPKLAAKPIAPKPQVTAKPRVELHIVKRTVEVLLRIKRPDGLELPFFHEATEGSRLEAELAAERQARDYGFKVLGHIQTTIKEQALDHCS
jgi:hypothetical protein